jgi:hypothetical protein
MTSQPRKKSPRKVRNLKSQTATSKTQTSESDKAANQNVTGKLLVEGLLDVKSGSLELGQIPPGPPSENPIIKGTLTIEGSLGKQGGHLELSPNDGATESPCIDFHYGLGSVQDYNVRLINAANNRLDFVTEAGGTVLSINGSNVGIGTLDSKGKLSIHSTIEEETALSITSTKSNKSDAMINLSLIEPTDFTHRLLTARKRNSTSDAWLDWTLEIDKGDEPGLQLWRAFRPDGQSPDFAKSLYLAWNGNVGIGTTSNLHPGLTIKSKEMGEVHRGGLYFQGAVDDTAFAGFYLNPNNDLVLKMYGGPWADAVAIKRNGNVGIGTTNPQRKLEISEDVGGISFEGFTASPNAGAIRFGDNTGWKLHVGRSREAVHATLNSGTAGVLMTIQDNGNVGIGTTSPQHSLHMGGGAFCLGGREWRNASSREYKKGAAPLTLKQALETLAGLAPVTFRYAEEPEEARHVGFIAEEVPELVAAKDRKSLSPMDIVGVLTKVVQDQQKEIAVLKKRFSSVGKNLLL